MLYPLSYTGHPAAGLEPATAGLRRSNCHLRHRPNCGAESLRELPKTVLSVSIRRNCLLRHSVHLWFSGCGYRLYTIPLREQAKTAARKAARRFTVDETVLFTTQQDVRERTGFGRPEGYRNAGYDVPEPAQRSICGRQPVELCVLTRMERLLCRTYSAIVRREKASNVVAKNIKRLSKFADHDTRDRVGAQMRGAMRL
jgi:hypothetical protein